MFWGAGFGFGVQGPVLTVLGFRVETEHSWDVGHVFKAFPRVQGGTPGLGMFVVAMWDGSLGVGFRVWGLGLG